MGEGGDKALSPSPLHSCAHASVTLPERLIFVTLSLLTAAKYLKMTELAMMMLSMLIALGAV